MLALQRGQLSAYDLVHFPMHMTKCERSHSEVDVPTPFWANTAALKYWGLPTAEAFHGIPWEEYGPDSYTRMRQLSMEQETVTKWQCPRTLRAWGVHTVAVNLLGPDDTFAQCWLTQLLPDVAPQPTGPPSDTHKNAQGSSEGESPRSGSSTAPSLPAFSFSPASSSGSSGSLLGSDASVVQHVAVELRFATLGGQGVPLSTAVHRRYVAARRHSDADEGQGEQGPPGFVVTRIVLPTAHGKQAVALTRARLLHEAHLCHKLRDIPGFSGAMRLEACFMHDDCVDMVHQWMPSASLWSILRARGPLSEPKARHVLLQLVNIFELLHSRSIVHVHANPSNVCIEGATGNVKLLGLPLCVSSSSWSACLQGPGVCVSPESAVMCVDSSSPMWSLGMLLLAMLVGVGVSLRRLPSALSTLSPAAVHLLHNMLKSSPSERIPLKRVRRHHWMNAEASSGSSGDDGVVNVLRVNSIKAFKVKPSCAPNDSIDSLCVWPSGDLRAHEVHSCISSAVAAAAHSGGNSSGSSSGGGEDSMCSLAVAHSSGTATTSRSSPPVLAAASTSTSSGSSSGDEALPSSMCMSTTPLIVNGNAGGERVYGNSGRKQRSHAHRSHNRHHHHHKHKQQHQRVALSGGDALPSPLKRSRTRSPSSSGDESAHSRCTIFGGHTLSANASALSLPIWTPQQQQQQQRQQQQQSPLQHPYLQQPHLYPHHHPLVNSTLALAPSLSSARLPARNALHDVVASALARHPAKMASLISYHCDFPYERDAAATVTVWRPDFCGGVGIAAVEDNASTVFLGMFNGDIHLMWDADLSLRSRITFHKSSHSIASLCTSGRVTFAGTHSGHVNVVDVHAGKLVLKLKAHNRPVTHVSASLDGVHVMAGDDCGRVMVYDVREGAPACGPRTYALDAGVLDVCHDGKAFQALTASGHEYKVSLPQAAIEEPPRFLPYDAFLSPEVSSLAHGRIRGNRMCWLSTVSAPGGPVTYLGLLDTSSQRIEHVWNLQHPVHALYATRSSVWLPSADGHLTAVDYSS